MSDWLNKLKLLNLGTLLEYMPHTGLDCIPWLEFLKQARQIIRVSADPKVHARWQSELQELFPGEWSTTNSPQLFSKSSWDKLEPEVRFHWGEKIIELYFLSLLKWRKVNLDFRADRFFLSRDLAMSSHWSLSRFYIQYDPKFCENMTMAYNGFYENRPKDFRQALSNMGVIGKEEELEPFEKLFQTHFGEPTDKPASFNLSEFKKSYFKLFQYIRKTHKKVPANFIWLGLCLSGLYECLENLGGEYQSRDIYRRVLLRIQSPQ